MVPTTLNASTTAGSVYVTDFTFTDLTTGVAIVNRIWDLGYNKLIYNSPTIQHIYQYPGSYTVQLTSYDINGNSYYAKKDVEVDYIFRDAIRFVQIPDQFSVPGLPTATTFKVAVTSAQINTPLILDLYASNARSVPFSTVDSKWGFLIPTWKFTDKNYSIIDTLSVETVNLYVNGKVAGVSGEAEFYYIDDLSTGLSDECPLLLIVTLQTSGFNYFNDAYTDNSYPSFANSTVDTAVVWKVHTLQPRTIDVTENYLNNVYPIKWSGVKIPFLITPHGFRENPLTRIKEKTGILFNVPSSNDDGLKIPITVTLTNVPSTDYIVEQTPIYFKKYDEFDNFAGGYIFTTITPLSPISATNVVASGIFEVDPIEDPDNYVWVSNPTNNFLHRIFLAPYAEDLLEQCPNLIPYKDDNLIVGKVFDIPVPYRESTNTFNYNMSGFSGIYGIAFNIPLQEVTVTDAELDTIYRYDGTTGIQLCSIQLSSVGGFSSDTQGYTPSNIAQDGALNSYVSLFNSVSVLKFDRELNFIQSLVPTGVIPNFVIPDTGDFLLKPPTVEPDSQNNVWVAYGHPLYSTLVKFLSTGQESFKITLPNNSIPVSIAINNQDQLWVANSYNVDGSNYQSELQLYSSTGALLSSRIGFNNISYIALDMADNLWFTYDIRKVGQLRRTTGIIETFLINEAGQVLPASATPVYSTDEEIGGLGVDIYNRVWVIDSQTNKTFTFSAKINITTSDVRVLRILPDSVLGYVNDVNNTFTFTLSNDLYKSAQANGDWTGSRWIKKYLPPLSAGLITGVSTPFTVYDFNNPPLIQRENENFNTAGYYKDLALPEILKQNTNLFDNFLGSVVGNSEPTNQQDIGQTVYEKIANFVTNHSDIETCNIQQLKSLALATNVECENLNTELPAEVAKYLDIASIPKHKLWGTRSPISLSSTDTIGPELNVSTAFLTAGTKIFLQNRFDNNNITLLDVPTKNSTLVYPLSELELYGFIAPVLQNYFFFEHIPVYSTAFIENFIDWNNPNTTISPFISSAKDWSGEYGTIERIFNYLLTKNLIVK